MYSDTRKLIVFSAPSGSGKTTIVRHLLEKTNLPLAFSVSATTRPPRGTEKEGVDYYFLSQSEFKTRIESGDFVEWEEVYPGVYYGTLTAEIERIWKSNKAVLFDIDVKGGLALKHRFLDQTLTVFVRPPSVDSLRQRLVDRQTDSDEQVEIRVAKAGEELKKAAAFDQILVNNTLEIALAEAEQLVANFLNS
jgi:guanylate kinase